MATAVQRVGDYELIRELAPGVGGMGRVYLSRRTGAAGFVHLCVLKELRPDALDNNPNALTLFRDEARIQGLLVHDCIVRVFDFIEEDGNFFIAMELVEGTSLSAVVGSKALGSFTPPLAAFVLSQAAEGLHFAHTLRDPRSQRPLEIVHRDISPGNILLSRSGQVKVADFGIARAVERESAQTGAGEFKGKVGYAAPEVLTAADAGATHAFLPTSDVYSLGVTLHEVLTGQRLFAGPFEQQFKRITRGQFVVPSELRPDLNIDPELDAIVARALERDPKKRTQTAGELSEQLLDWLSSRTGAINLKRELAKWVSARVPALDVSNLPPVERTDPNPNVISAAPRRPDSAPLSIIGEIEALAGVKRDHPTPPKPVKAAVTGEIGAVIAGYQIDRMLGRGSMGRVYLGTHLKLGRKAAIKILNDELAHDAQFVSRFFQEAKIVNDVRHPNIVDIFDFVEQEAPLRVAYVMEYVEGGSLTSEIKKGLSIGESIELLLQMASALDAVHRIGVIHRDLKPENVLVGPSRQIKILDFGIAKVAGEAAHQTVKGHMLGTPTYMAPEQVIGAGVSPKTDVYALGEILFEMIARRPLFVGETPAILYTKVNSEGPEVVLPDSPVSNLLTTLIRNCVTRHPRNRPELSDVWKVLAGQVAQTLGLRNMPRAPRDSWAAPATSPVQVPNASRPEAAFVEASLAPVTSTATQTSTRSSRERLSAPKPPYFWFAGGGLLLASGLATVVVLARSGGQQGGELVEPETVTVPSVPDASVEATQPSAVQPILPDASAPVNRASRDTTAKAAPERPEVPTFDRVLVRSNPDGAEVFDLETGRILGRTPLEVMVASGGARVVQLRSPGHATRELRVSSGERSEVMTLDRLPESPNKAPVDAEGRPIKRDELPEW